MRFLFARCPCCPAERARMNSGEPSGRCMTWFILPSYRRFWSPLVVLAALEKDLLDLIQVLRIVGHRGPDLLHGEMRQRFVTDAFQVAAIYLGVADHVVDGGAGAFEDRITPAALGIAHDGGGLIDT